MKCDGDSRLLAEKYSQNALFALSQLLKEVDRLWTKYPEEADHTWKGNQ